MKSKHLLLVVLLINVQVGLAVAQGKLSDYQNAEALNGLMQKKIYNAPANVQWLSAAQQYFYTKRTAGGLEFIRFNPKGYAKTPAFDQERFATALSAWAKEKIKANDLPILMPVMSNDGQTLKFTYKTEPLSCDLNSYTLNKAPSVSGRDRHEGRTTSPDGKWIGYVKNFNIYISDASDSGKTYQLSKDGISGHHYSPYLYWSPDSKKLAGYKVKSPKPRLTYLIESSPTDQLQPKLRSRIYAKPGDSLDQFSPSLFLIETKKQIPVDNSAIPEQFNLTEPVWRKDSRAFTYEYNKRGHQQYSVMEVNVAGISRELIREESKTFITYSRKKYRFDLADGNEIIWASERDGWNHLYLFDRNGQLKNQITKGNWVMRRVIKVNEKERWIIFEGSGMEKDQDPYFIQYYKINLDGSGLKKLTWENGNHMATFNEDYSAFIDVYSRADQPATTVWRDGRTGKVLQELEKSDISPLLNTGWKLPEVFSAKGRDGETDIWGMIIRPRNFDPTKKYPVIEYIYAGPHDSFVPKNFIADQAVALHELAELGFIVVQCDGMGTSNRSKAFHDVCWQNLKDAGFPDRIAFIKAAAKKYPYMDLNKVGIYGSSAGGQSSLGALLFHPEFYKVAVSSSGCHDNRMDKIWWNEQWMGYPIGPQYAASSNVDHAANLQGKLLLILGELDENVDPSSTMQVMNKLIKANKNFDFLIVPGMGHSIGGDYGEHKRRDFFVKHLLGVEPPEWNWKPEITVPKP
ncbi:S9 family peptidase [Pedobacter caeni]|uniref:Dipeptidyl aminopeptidase/acylaminoacyl peptidase n=1 Tax=Pedobacter caeni TaxID=288992 RepID=A0A1M5JUJ5_9SPHI|nr:prolyl oligopeptidase family serine peptidase [Pedobacter caeni]SHG44075.1 Dipeptidyl aminopeptidase/acylaminoacyl peptidase [Pedobacter caeni]